MHSLVTASSVKVRIRSVPSFPFPALTVSKKIEHFESSGTFETGVPTIESTATAPIAS